jgi:hypothetical protein
MRPCRRGESAIVGQRAAAGCQRGVAAVSVMIQITPHIRIVVAVEPVDFRKGIDSLAAVCRQKLQNDAFSSAMFVFTNKSRQALRLLVYDGQGFWLCHKQKNPGKRLFFRGFYI